MKANDNYRGHKTELREAQRVAKQHDVERRIKEENESFAAMTPAQKRVRIAEDVLEWMKVGRLVATSGSYLSLRDESGRHRRAPTVNGFECHACALGSVFAVAVERCAVPEPSNIAAIGDTTMRNRLSSFFDRDQLVMIENAFEGFGGEEQASKFCDDLPKWNFDGDYDDAMIRARMERIMRNIIANNGTFVP